MGEFIDALNEQKQAGRIRLLGASNWTMERFEAANEYARGRGLAGFCLLSNQLSLARMVEPPWPGCLSVGDQAGRAWLTRTQTTLLPWSSQACGFFTDRSRPEDRSDEMLARCWYSNDNFRRKDRAVELAAKRGLLPINIAWAYVLCQPFPTFPIVGPRTLAETRTSLPARRVELIGQERRRIT